MESRVHTRERTFELKALQSTPQTVWPIAGRIGFRYAFCFLLISLLVVFSPLRIIPLIGSPFSNAVDTVATASAHWIAIHAFHLSGVAAEDHPTDSRDTALNWITLGLISGISLAVTFLWSVFDRRRRQYQVAAAWLRFLLRMFLVFLMLRYGLGKVFPLQMSRPSLAVLNEPLGQTSPMTLLWTLIGLHPAYQILCGAFETLAACLLFFRRTALFGALLNAFIMANVLLYNLFFDVPVKVGAGLILVATLAVIAPDLKSLYHYFWLGLPTAPTGVWVPPHEQRIFRIGTQLVESGFLLLALYALIPGAYTLAHQERDNVQHPGTLTGEWRVDSDTLSQHGRTMYAPILTAEGSPLTSLALEPDGRVMARSADGRLWRAGMQVDAKEKLFTLYSGWFDGVRFQGRYRYAQPDAQHLILEPFKDATHSLGTLTLTRMPMPAHYPLLERRFHWISEWAYER